jgi:hypothetical protein
LHPGSIPGEASIGETDHGVGSLAEKGCEAQGRLTLPSCRIVAVGLGMFRPRLPNDPQGTDTPHRNFAVPLALPESAFTFEFQTPEAKRNAKGITHHLLLRHTQTGTRPHHLQPVLSNLVYGLRT